LIDSVAAVVSSVGAAHVLVAGDVFDNAEPGDRVVMRAISRMERASVTWWLAPGNHDNVRAGGLLPTTTQRNGASTAGRLDLAKQYADEGISLVTLDDG
jgi:DNA repair exonuclease SbcCD nuclease subunit